MFRRRGNYLVVDSYDHVQNIGDQDEPGGQLEDAKDGDADRRVAGVYHGVQDVGTFGGTLAKDKGGDDSIQND